MQRLLGTETSSAIVGAQWVRFILLIHAECVLN